MSTRGNSEAKTNLIVLFNKPRIDSFCLPQGEKKLWHFYELSKRSRIGKADIAYGCKLVKSVTMLVSSLIPFVLRILFT